MKKYISLVLLVLWMIFIFTMSNTSSIDSSNQSGFIVEFINKIFGFGNTEILEIIIRKLAHLFEYIVLGVLMINYLKNYKIKRNILFTIILCFIYACSDEIHQLFIQGRSGNIIDIMLDTIGAIIGIIIYQFINN